MQESLKVAKLSIASNATLSYYEIPIFPGKGQIALLKTIIWNMITPGVEQDNAYAWVWRKSHPNERATFAADWQRNQDVIAYKNHSIWWETAVGWGVNNASCVHPFPEPGLVLLRPPQLVLQAAGVDKTTWYPFFYYVLAEVTNDEMTMLMAKDHA